MELKKCLLHLANTLQGKFVEYSTDKDIIVVPIEGCQCQTVISQIVEKNGAVIAEFSSKVGELSADRENHQVILKINQELFHSKVIIQDWQLKVSSEVLLQQCNEQLLKDVIMEVATVAFHLDHQEVKTTTEEVIY
jgi:hypothetical protein